LPERPEQSPKAPRAEKDWLFDSSREYLTQMQFYQRWRKK
jgi:hypothetical protein